MGQASRRGSRDAASRTGRHCIAKYRRSLVFGLQGSCIHAAATVRAATLDDREPAVLHRRPQCCMLKLLLVCWRVITAGTSAAATMMRPLLAAARHVTSEPASQDAGSRTRRHCIANCRRPLGCGLQGSCIHAAATVRAATLGDRKPAAREWCGCAIDHMALVVAAYDYAAGNMRGRCSDAHNMRCDAEVAVTARSDAAAVRAAYDDAASSTAACGDAPAGAAVCDVIRQWK
jgi:hypothetical protein